MKCNRCRSDQQAWRRSDTARRIPIVSKKNTSKGSKSAHHVALCRDRRFHTLNVDRRDRLVVAISVIFVARTPTFKLRPAIVLRKRPHVGVSSQSRKFVLGKWRNPSYKREGKRPQGRRAQVLASMQMSQVLRRTRTPVSLWPPSNGADMPVEKRTRNVALPPLLLPHWCQGARKHTWRPARGERWAF